MRKLLSKLILIVVCFFELTNLWAANKPGLCNFLYPLIAIGQFAKEIILVVHQGKAFDEDKGRERIADTNRALTNDPSLNWLPIFLLESLIPSFQFTPGITEELKTRSFPVASLDGAYRSNGMKFNSSRVHLMGGSCGECLARTVKDLILDLKESERNEMTLIFHTRLIYGSYFHENLDEGGSSLESLQVLVGKSVMSAETGRIEIENTNNDGEFRLRFEALPELSIVIELTPKLAIDVPNGTFALRNFP